MGCELLFIVNREDTFLAIQGGIWVISLPLLTSVLGMYWSSINASVNFDALGNYCPKTLVAQSINWLLPALPVRTYTFMLHQCNPLKFSKHSYAVYHCLGFDSLETVWDADSCASIYWGSAFRRNLKWNKGGTTGQGKRPGQDVGSADPMGSFWSMNYTTKLSYPEVRGLAISVYYWCWATFGKGSNLAFPGKFFPIGWEQFSEECNWELLTTHPQSSWEIYYNHSKCLLTQFTPWKSSSPSSCVTAWKLALI